jgi:hypothetical protein
MDTKGLIERVVASGVLAEEMTELPSGGASEFELKGSEKRVGLKLNDELVGFLRNFNGVNLDVIRFYTCDHLERSEYGLKFADDPAGFIYHLTDIGEVLCEDHDGGETKRVALSMQDFIHSYLFGSRSIEFAGEEWHLELIDAGIAT